MHQNGFRPTALYPLYLYSAETRNKMELSYISIKYKNLKHILAVNLKF